MRAKDYWQLVHNCSLLADSFLTGVMLTFCTTSSQPSTNDLHLPLFPQVPLAWHVWIAPIEFISAALCALLAPHTQLSITFTLQVLSQQLLLGVLLPATLLALSEKSQRLSLASTPCPPRKRTSAESPSDAPLDDAPHSPPSNLKTTSPDSLSHSPYATNSSLLGFAKQPRPAVSSPPLTTSTTPCGKATAAAAATPSTPPAHPMNPTAAVATPLSTAATPCSAAAPASARPACATAPPAPWAADASNKSSVRCSVYLSGSGAALRGALSSCAPASKSSSMALYRSRVTTRSISIKVRRAALQLPCMLAVRLVLSFRLLGQLLLTSISFSLLAHPTHSLMEHAVGQQAPRAG
jgi:hypothetical protein